MDNPVVHWSNPRNVDLTKLYVYFIQIRSNDREYRYVGKGSSPSRMDAYARNVSKVLSGKSKRPTVKRDGTPQREGNIKFRYVHLVLAVAVQRGWDIEHYPLQNCQKTEHTKVENQLKIDLECDLNDGESWFVEDFVKLAREIR